MDRRLCLIGNILNLRRVGKFFHLPVLAFIKVSFIVEQTTSLV